MPSAFIDPAALSAPSPSVDSDMGSPPPQPMPSRKRPRTDMSAEERKEARAHRNRIAAQNSRDRRKLQFSQLNARVSELEEENRQLKDELALYRSKHHPTPQVVPTFTDSTRERENEELRERVRSLEKSWESVVRMLASQTKSSSATTAALPTPPRSTSSDSGNSPLFAHASPTLSMLSTSDGSLDEHTRHSAAGGSESPSGSVSILDSITLDTSVDKTNIITINSTANSPRSSIAKSDSSIASSPSIKIGDHSNGVEDWFMDLISSSPVPADADPAGVLGTTQDPAAASPAASSSAASVMAAASPFEWDGTNSSSDEMQTLLALLPPPEVARDELAGLGLDLGAVSATEPWNWTGTSDVPITV